MEPYSAGYINGNYIVNISRFKTVFETREFVSLRVNENLIPSFPDSIDLKITNKCSWGCSFCHESSGPKGKTFNLENTKRILDKLPSIPIEIAIGGGNIFECFPKFRELYDYILSKNMCPRFTVNVKDLLDKNKYDLITELSQSSSYSPTIGISISNKQDFINFSKLIHPFGGIPLHTVFHVIVGIFPHEDFLEIIENQNITALNKFLILGYKQFGRASGTEIKDLDNWKSMIPKIMYKNRNVIGSSLTIGFDNLAVDQLEIKNCLLKDEWDSYFLGQDFSHTMYVDAVEETFAPTSRSPHEDRVKWSEFDYNIVDYFNKYKKIWN